MSYALLLKCVCGGGLGAGHDFVSFFCLSFYVLFHCFRKFNAAAVLSDNSLQYSLMPGFRAANTAPAEFFFHSRICVQAEVSPPELPPRSNRNPRWITPGSTRCHADIRKIPLPPDLPVSADSVLPRSRKPVMPHNHSSSTMPSDDPAVSASGSVQYAVRRNLHFLQKSSIFLELPHDETTGTGGVPVP